MENSKKLPDWLKTLWTISPSLAKQTEKDYLELSNKLDAAETKLAWPVPDDMRLTDEWGNPMFEYREMGQ